VGFEVVVAEIAAVVALVVVVEAWVEGPVVVALVVVAEVWVDGPVVVAFLVVVVVAEALVEVGWFMEVVGLVLGLLYLFG